MKKNKILYGAVAILIAISICGCGGSEGDDAKNQGNSNSNVENMGDSSANAGNPAGNMGEGNTSGGYSFEVNNVVIGVDMDMDELVDKLVEAKSVYEVPSCAGDGVDYIYEFGAYEIETYPAVDGKNRIGRITLWDDTVSTTEGIDLSMTKADVIRIYGEDYEEAGAQIVYTKNGTILKFVFDGDNIISIEYNSPVVG